MPFDKKIFLTELSSLIAVNGKVNVNQYCAILDLVAKYFIQKAEVEEGDKFTHKILERIRNSQSDAEARRIILSVVNGI